MVLKVKTPYEKKITTSNLLKFTLPSIIMMVFMSLYTITDGIFVSRFLGSNALSSINIVFPIISFITAFGVMIATGGSAIIAKKMGEGKREHARSSFTFFVVVGIIFSIITLVFTLVFLSPIVRFLGANDSLMENCRAYLGTLVLFAPACVLQLLFQSFFVTDGNPHIGLVLTIIGGVTNAVFDYIFLGPMGFGIEGAAIATGLGQMIPAVFGIFYFFLSKKELFFVRFSFDGPTLLKACLNGSSEMVSNLSNAIITYLFNIIMMRMVGESGVAAITIILYGQFLFNSLYLGFSIGIAPIISYNFGAKNHSNLKKIFHICNGFVIITSIVITGISYGLADIIVSAFIHRSEATYLLGVNGFKLFSFCYLFSGFNIFTSGLFTALSNGKISAIISFSRTLICMVVFLIVLPYILGINGVWLAVPFAELVTVVLSLYYQKNAITECR